MSKTIYAQKDYVWIIQTFTEEQFKNHPDKFEFTTYETWQDAYNDRIQRSEKIIADLEHKLKQEKEYLEAFKQRYADNIESI